MIEPRCWEIARSIMNGLKELPHTEGHDEACEAIKVWYLKSRIEAIVDEIKGSHPMEGE